MEALGGGSCGRLMLEDIRETEGMHRVDLTSRTSEEVVLLKIETFALTKAVIELYRYKRRPTGIRDSIRDAGIKTQDMLPRAREGNR